jgi:hypothetical protein
MRTVYSKIWIDPYRKARRALDGGKEFYIYDSFYKVEVHIKEKVDDKIKDQVKKPIYSSLWLIKNDY